LDLITSPGSGILICRKLAGNMPSLSPFLPTNHWSSIRLTSTITSPVCIINKTNNIATQNVRNEGQILYTNIDQALVNSLHGSLNFKEVN